MLLENQPILDALLQPEISCGQHAVNFTLPSFFCNEIDTGVARLS